jgi:hypothetical protein
MAEHHGAVVWVVLLDEDVTIEAAHVLDTVDHGVGSTYGTWDWSPFRKRYAHHTNARNYCKASICSAVSLPESMIRPME